ncbi:MAG: hypothetical protein C4299_04895 [Thermoleophilia bacterium]
MERERARFLASLDGQGEQAGGFYPRKLNLKVPRVRHAKSFRPAPLPPRWKRTATPCAPLRHLPCSRQGHLQEVTMGREALERTLATGVVRKRTLRMRKRIRGMSSAELRQIRLQLGLSQMELAKILGVQQPTVSRWERGMSPVPKSAALVLRMLASGK